MSKFILFIAGVSGAGKSEALKCLEDLGYDCIDNMPLRLIPNLLEDVEALPERLVLAIDGRNRDIQDHAVKSIEALKKRVGIEKQLIFLDAEEDELVRRYKETRRRHPEADGKDIRKAINREKEALQPFRELAETVLDTTDFKPKQLWQYMRKHYREPDMQALQVYVMSFGYKHGMPREADYVFDVRFLKNPYWHKELKSKTGLEIEVQDFVKSDDNFSEALNSICHVLTMPLQKFQQTDKASVTVAIGCTGGQHRSVTMATALEQQLANEFNVHVYHRDL